MKPDEEFEQYTQERKKHYANESRKWAVSFGLGGVVFVLALMYSGYQNITSMKEKAMAEGRAIECEKKQKNLILEIERLNAKVDGLADQLNSYKKPANIN